jgi:hypothetical protein
MRVSLACSKAIFSHDGGNRKPFLGIGTAAKTLFLFLCSDVERSDTTRRFPEETYVSLYPEDVKFRILHGGKI